LQSHLLQPQRLMRLGQQSLLPILLQSTLSFSKDYGKLPQYAAADLLVSRHIVDLFSACEQQLVAAVRVLAGDALNSWRCLALTHLRFLAGFVSLINSFCSMQLAFTVFASCVSCMH
jgi:hypothetical protein